MMEGSPPIKVHISSGGGDVSPGLDIYDILKYYPGTKTGIVHHWAASMAAMVLQACDLRTSTPHAQILIHHISRQSVSLNVLRNDEQFRKFKEEMEESQNKLYQILIRRTGKTLEEVSKTCEEDISMSAEKAIEYGLLDQIIETEDDLTSVK